LKSILKKHVKSISAGALGLFFFFSGDIYQSFINLPQALSWAGAIVIVLATFLGVGLAKRKWPTGFQSNQGMIRKVFDRVKDSLWVFIMYGLVRIFYPLTVSLLPYYQYPGFWIFIGLEAALFTDVYYMREPEKISMFGRWLFKLFQQSFHEIHQLDR
jgi:hypothetical protein